MSSNISKKRDFVNWEVVLWETDPIPIPGATIRISMPIGEDEKATLATLKEFLAETVRVIERY